MSPSTFERCKPSSIGSRPGSGGVTRGSARESGAADGSRQACRSGYASGFSRNAGTTSAVQRTHPSAAYWRLVTVTPEKPRVRVLLLL